MTLGLMDPDLVRIVMVVVGLSMAVTPLLAWLGAHLTTLSGVSLTESPVGIRRLSILGQPLSTPVTVTISS